jgi:hypothetical protein
MLLGAAVVGLAIGGLRTYIEMRQGAELFMPAEYAVLASKRADDARRVEPGKLPKAEVVGSAEYNFGSMDRDATQQHTFQLKNVGQAPLVVEKGPTTCKCTVGALPKGVLEPGETVDISVEWTGKTTLAQVDFVQAVQIKTNDPDQPFVEFIIRGYVTDSVRVLPSELAVGTISADDTVHTTFRLFAFRSEHLEILESSWENQETAECFELTWEPIPEAEVKEEKGATVGLLGKVAIKPGLPLGPINQTITLKVRADEDNDVRIPIGGRKLSDIRLASSPRFDANRNVVSLGVVPRDKTARAVLQMYVTGPYRHETHFSVVEVDPASHLSVTVSEPKELNQGKSLQYTVTIEAAGSAGPVNRLGSEKAPRGRVVLETTHPQTKRVPIDIRFAVE